MAGSVMKDMTGAKYGRLTVLHFSHYDERRQPYWACSCECGGKITTRGAVLRGGITKSCGCLRLETITKHGHNHSEACGGKSPTYRSWNSMHNRCQATTGKIWAAYGAKGISVCEAWKEFENFLADMGERPEGKTLDRKDNSLGYFKENCRWATRQEQNQNQTTTKLSVEKVVAIRLDPRKNSVIALELGVGQDVISRVKNNKAWKTAVPVQLT